MSFQRFIRVPLIGITLALISCKKDNTTVTRSFVSCSDTQQLDSSAIHNRLIGTWTLELRRCFNSTTPLHPVVDQRVNFKTDNSYQVYSNTAILAGGNWQLKDLGENRWGLNLSTPSPLLQGRILYCEDVLVMDSTYVNGVGCSSYYFRSN